MMDIPEITDAVTLETDVLVIGGGTAGSMAAISAAEHGASVLLLEKAHVRHSGALAMGMDGVNNAVIPGRATPEEYVAEITRANDGIINQRTVHQTATRGYDMVRRLEGYGVKFDKDEQGDYRVRRVHRSGSYVLPMPEGKDVKKVLYRVLRTRAMRERIRIENRVMPVRVLTSDGRACGAVGFNTRTGELVTVRAGAVVLATGACGRLGLPASGYLYGTYENPTNAGDGHAMAYHAGAELSGIECFQVNPLIKDYNGPACAYVANPFGGYQVNNQGERFVDCDYWSGQMMAEVAREIASARGPVYLKLTHLPDETITTLEGILHSTERPTRGTFHANRGHDYRTHDVEMHISEIGLCGGHSSSGVWVDEHGATTVPGLYAAGDLACVPHNYMIGAFVFGDLAGTHAAGVALAAGSPPEPSDGQVAAAHELIYRPLRNAGGAPQQQVEYKLRRFVNDYVAPPKSGAKLTIAVETFERMRGEIAAMGAETPHELMRCVEVSFIRDCAEMAARSSLVRTESRWGLYHERLDHPDRDDDSWLYHLNLRRRPDGLMEFLKRPVAPYLVPVAGFEVPLGRTVEVLGPVEVSAEQVSVSAPATADEPVVAGPTSPRIVELLALTEQQPDLARIEPYLTDADPGVRRTGVAILTELSPAGTGLALAGMLADDAQDVRAAAAHGLRELVSVLAADDTLRRALLAAGASPDPLVRVAVLDLLRELRIGDRATFAAGRTDPRSAVRLSAVRGLVSLSEGDLLADAASDPAREVRVAVAAGIGTLTDAGAAATLATLAGDIDPLVQEQALTAAAAIGCPPPFPRLAVEALRSPNWRIRVGGTTALGGADREVGLAPLRSALRDTNLDVRKAAVQALAPWSGDPEVDEALAEACTDADADVRAYGRSALARVRA